MKEENSFAELCKVMDVLLGENGCAWDRAQTHESMRSHLLEESYEVADAIDHKDMTALQEELGDLLLQVIMHSRLAEKAGHFSLSDVSRQAAEKLIRRHSHIFGNDKAQTPKEVEATWEANKNKEKSISTALENMKAVPKALPALERAQKVIKRSNKDFSQKSLIEEIHMLLDKIGNDGNNMVNYGKTLFLLTALSTKMQINAEFTLTNAILAFINNFE